MVDQVGIHRLIAGNEHHERALPAAAGTPGLLLSGSRDEGAILASVKMEQLPAGRGRLVHRRLGSVLVQTARA